jgi:hypothetical protein
LVTALEKFGRKSSLRERRKQHMDTTMIVRIVAGVLAVVVLAFVIYRRKRATK